MAAGTKKKQRKQMRELAVANLASTTTKVLLRTLEPVKQIIVKSRHLTNRNTPTSSSFATQRTLNSRICPLLSAKEKVSSAP